MTEGRTIYYLKQLGKLLILSVLLVFAFFQPAQAARQQQAIDCSTVVFVSHNGMRCFGGTVYYDRWWHDLEHNTNWLMSARIPAPGSGYRV